MNQQIAITEKGLPAMQRSIDAEIMECLEIDEAKGIFF